MGRKVFAASCSLPDWDQSKPRILSHVHFGLHTCEPPTKPKPLLHASLNSSHYSLQNPPSDGLKWPQAHRKTLFTTRQAGFDSLGAVACCERTRAPVPAILLGLTKYPYSSNRPSPAATAHVQLLASNSGANRPETEMVAPQALRHVFRKRIWWRPKRSTHVFRKRK